MAHDPRYRGALSAVLNGIGDVVRSRREQPPEDDGTRLDGSWCLITGPTSGLGFETATRLLERGSNLIVASRSAGPELEQRLRERIRSESRRDTHGRTPEIEAHRLDLASFGSVEAFVDKLVGLGRRLATVVFNAGLVASQARRTEDGFDEMLQVNYLSNHLLATRLIERGVVVPASDSAARRPPRYVFVSSEAHRSSPDVPESDVLEAGKYGVRGSIGWYGYSKLLLTAFTEELSRRFNTGGETRLTVLTMCPGAMSTGIAREAPAVVQPLLQFLFRLTFPGPEKSAQVVTHLASSSEFNAATGLYYHLASRKDKDARARDPELTARLWRESEAAIATTTGRASR